MNIIFEERMRESANRPRIYFDHAATTSPRPEVLDVVTRTLQDDFGNPSSFYQEGHRASWLLEDARARIAACLQVQPEEI
ncbi:MAG: aminotransferase class V-fold PLP-dependent enzyme, partial [Clostridiaceae bacterium]|nr:aminotransferase class V-fold PLP-dependent enzyme [Clostridiaceae bacterium]